MGQYIYLKSWSWTKNMALLNSMSPIIKYWFRIVYGGIGNVSSGGYRRVSSIVGDSTIPVFLCC